MSVVQMSLNTTSGEVRELPKSVPTPEPVAAPATPAVQEPEKVAAAAPETAPEKKPDPLSKGFSVIAKKEKEYRQRMAQMKAKEQELAEKEAQITRFQQLKNQNPLEAVQALGLTYEDLVKFQLSGGQTPTTELEIKNIKEQMQAYVKQQEAKEQAQLQAKQKIEQEQNDQTLADYKAQVAEQIKAKTDDYELINIEGQDAIDVIFETIRVHFLETNQLLTVDQVAKELEKKLTEDTEKKIAAKKFAVVAKTEQQKTEPKLSGTSAMERAAGALAGPRPTLNNSMTASTSPNLAAPRLENDRMARAMAALDKYK